MNAKIAAIIAVAIVAAGALVAGAIVFTSNDKSDGGGTEAISRAEWQNKVIAAGGSESSDWDALADLAEEDCSMDADEWALRLSLSGATPEVNRAGLEYKCPEKVAVFDDGQAQLRDTVAKFDQLCSTPYEELSPDDQQLADAYGC